RTGRPNGRLMPTRRRRVAPAGDAGARPWAIAATALIRPARIEGTIAARPAVAPAPSTTSRITGIEIVETAGRPNDSAVSARIGWLAQGPTNATPRAPDAGGARVWR